MKINMGTAKRASSSRYIRENVNPVNFFTAIVSSVVCIMSTDIIAMARK